MLKMTIDNEEVVSKNDFTIKEEMQSASSTILNNTYPKSWEQDKDYTSRFYYPKDYAKLNIQNFTRVQEAEAGTTVQINGSATLTDVDTTKNSRVMKLLGQTSQTGTPTPSSPIPVNVVSGDNSINVCGKNLFNPQKVVEDSNSAYVYLTNDNKFIRFITSATGRIYFYPNVKGNTQYTFKATYKSASSTSNNIIFYAMYSDGTNSVLINATTTDTNEHTSYGTTTSGKTLSYIMSGNTNGYETFIKIDGTQLEVGNQTTNYEPYIGNTYPIYLGVENLVDFATQSFTTYKDYTGLNIKAGTYTFSAKITSSDTTYQSSRVYFYGDNNYQTLINLTRGTRASSTIVLTQDINRIVLYASIDYTSSNGKTATYEDIQLEKGSKANHYTPYGTTPIELCKIGDYQDYIYKENNKWLLHKEIGKVVLDGSETGWNAYKQDNNLYSYYKNIANSKSNYTGASNYYSYFKWVSGNSSLNNGEASIGGLTTAKNGNFIFCVGDATNELATFKTWLGTHNVVTYYVLATPTTTEITDTLLVSQLDNLESS